MNTKKYPNVFLSLGIDPNPTVLDYKNFHSALKKHTRFLDEYSNMLQQTYLKVQLAFFLKFGSKGIKLLEQFVNRFKGEFNIIIDGKFNDIQNSLNAYLDFVFCTLGASGITVNPFLGEESIALAFEKCAKHAGSKGRVFVLCATSESSNSHLSYMQENWQKELDTIVSIREKIFSNQSEFKSIPGVVIGANKENILLSKKLSDSHVSVLIPGLGAQGKNWDLIQKCAHQNNEFIFNVGRGVFEGGHINLKKIKINFDTVMLNFR